MNINCFSSIINNNNRIAMKLKSYIILTVVVALLLGGGITSRAQGFFSPNTKDQTETETTNDGGFFRAPPGIGDDSDPDPGGDDEGPIGEGLVILSLLSGAYALVKRNVKRKHEN